MTKFGRYLPSEHTLKQRERTQRAIQIDNQRKEKANKMGFDLQNYETVADRLVRWWQAYPEGRIETHIYSYDGTRIVMRAEGFNNEDRLISTGYAEETLSDRGVNATSFVENCETSAIGRACANYVFATQGKRPSREEMQKVERQGGSAQPSVHTPSGGFATPKQIGYIKKLARDAGLDDLRLLELIQRTLNSDEAVLELLKSHEASAVIEALK